MKFAIMYRPAGTGETWKALNVIADTEESARRYVIDNYHVIGNENIASALFSATTPEYQNDTTVETVTMPDNTDPENLKTRRIEIDGSANFPAPHTFWNNSPRLILNPDAIPEPIDTARNPHIAMMLRYQAEELMSSVFSDWYDDVLSRDEIENSSFFSDDSLNLNDGDGYQIAENLFIDHIFAVDLYGAPRGIVAIYDSADDDFSYWLIY